MGMHPAKERCCGVKKRKECITIRVTDNYGGEGRTLYAPAGKRILFVCGKKWGGTCGKVHDDIPPEVQAAFERLQAVYGTQTRAVNPLYASK